MSVDLIVYLNRTSMPEPARWAQAIASQQLPVALDTAFDVDTFTGYLPCKFKGDDSGFEYYSSRVGIVERLRLRLSWPTNFKVMFVTHSDMRECATSIVASSVLCLVSQGYLSDPQSGITLKPSEVMAWCRSELQETGLFPR